MLINWLQVESLEISAGKLKPSKITVLGYFKLVTKNFNTNAKQTILVGDNSYGMDNKVSVDVGSGIICGFTGRSGDWSKWMWMLPTFASLASSTHCQHFMESLFCAGTIQFICLFVLLTYIYTKLNSDFTIVACCAVDSFGLIFLLPIDQELTRIINATSLLEDNYGAQYVPTIYGSIDSTTLWLRRPHT